MATHMAANVRLGIQVHLIAFYRVTVNVNKQYA